MKVALPEVQKLAMKFSSAEISDTSVFLINTNDSGIDVSIALENEIESASRYLNQHDRKRFLLARIALRIILENLLSKNSQQLIFDFNENGKPSLAGSHQLMFNISHTKEMIAIAVSRINNIGVDIEWQDESFITEDIIKSHFHREEQLLMKEGNDWFNFYSIWTRKEALFKANGIGLIDELAAINVKPTAVNFRSKTYFLDTFILPGNYLLSIALENEPALPAFFYLVNK